MNRPLEITTTTHPIAISMYVVQVLLGVLNITGLQTARGLTLLLGPTLVGFWALLVTFSGVLALWGAFLAPQRRHDPSDALRIEMAGCVGIFLTRACYEVSLAATLGFTTLETQGLTIALALGSLFRIRQIRQQVRRLHESKRKGFPSDPPPLADATNGA